MHRTRTLRVTVATLSACSVLAGGVALAAGPSGQNHQPGQGGQAGQPGGRPGGGGPAGPHFLHAQGVVTTKTGTAVEATQSGTVTAVDAASVTVASTDGYSATYVIASTTKVHAGKGVTLPAVGAKVDVVAVVAGGTSTASSIDVRPTAKPRAAAPSAAASPTA